MPTKSLERWNRDGEYLKNQFEAKGYDVSIRYSDNKIEQQVKDIEDLIADNVDRLIMNSKTVSRSITSRSGCFRVSS